MDLEYTRSLGRGLNFAELDPKTRSALQICCGAEYEETEKLYGRMIFYLVNCLEILASGRQPLFGKISHPTEHKSIGKLFRGIHDLIAAYDELTPFERELGEMCLQNPELDHEAVQNDLPPFGEDELAQAFMTLSRIHERYSTGDAPPLGRPKGPELREPAALFCAEWEALTGRPPTWNTDGTSGLYEFHRLVSECFDATIAIAVSAEGGSDGQMIETSSSHYRSRTGGALKAAARMRR